VWQTKAFLATILFLVATDCLFFDALVAAGADLRGRAGLAASQRARLLDGMTNAVAEKGYARVSVADVIERAGVSRRTFYEIFRDKEDCFLAAYAAGAELVMDEVVAAVLASPPEWRVRLEAALTAFVRVLSEHPDFSRTLLLDVAGAGPDAVLLRRRVHGDFAERLGRLGERAENEEELAPIPELSLRALVGGISELVQHQILDEGAESLPQLAGPLTELATAVFEGASSSRPVRLTP
jgi:AcrR family transcriptional regulator